jgi:hypothetical protein
MIVKSASSNFNQTRGEQRHLASYSRISYPLLETNFLRWIQPPAHGSFTLDTTHVENAYEVPVNEVLQSPSASFTLAVNYLDGRKTTVQLSPAQMGTASASYLLK